MIKGTFTPTRCLVVLVAASCVLLFALVPRYDLFEEPQTLNVLVPRQGLFGGGVGDTTTASDKTGTASDTTSTSATTGTTTANTGTTSSTSSTLSTTTSSSTTTSASSTTTQQQTTTTPPNTSTQQQSTGTTSQQTGHTTAQTETTQSPVTTAVVTTQSDGEVQTVIVTSTPPAPSSTSSSAADSTGDDDDSGSNKTSTIIGLSVAGGVALIGLIAFFVWKFTRKRAVDEFDDGEAIKWPELNNHNNTTTALPTTTRGLEAGSPSDISRAPSRMNDGYAASVAASSTTELYAPSHDPYAVPPLPHMNPNQPYHDDPAAYGPAGYYDPYRGPIPQTFNDTASVHDGEAIPMTQLAANRARSPAPGLALDMTGRASPGPMMRGASPAPPQYGYGRASPGPQVGLGLGGPVAGRQSPGPQMAYDMGPR
ncbi:hypothetical protein OE88DRAFT_1668249 [Heliocybe sulcata]|uniref:Mid2 domain-containing protein n=1 Tax=Heliocybe sulcata TaxID=5364 RepID=A0A5C3ML01_9AGAM|nr:hypothetical protein OE88DRAFT_1668249 [Heliocybe sulcata]